MSENGNQFRPPRDGLIRAVMTLPVPAEDGETEVEERAAQFRAEGDDGTPILFGYLTRFNEWTEINSMFEGHFMERFSPGSLKKTFSELTPKVLFQHGMDPQIAKKPLGAPRMLEERSVGAYYEVPLLDTAYNRELEPGLRNGLYGSSISFSVMRDEINKQPKRSEYNPEGLPERTVREARVKEFGPVTFPAYEGATAGVRSLTDEFIAARFASDSDAMRRLISFIDRLDEAEEKEPERAEQEPAPSTTPGPRPTSRRGSKWLTPRESHNKRSSRWL